MEKKGAKQKNSRQIYRHRDMCIKVCANTNLIKT